MGRAGYSLLEILIVLSIISLIVAVVGPRMLGQLDRSKVTAARVQVQALHASLDGMAMDVGRYPTEAEGLELLVRGDAGAVPGWAGPYLEKGLPPDPWKRPYEYAPPRTPEARPDVFSLGSDGKAGGEGLAADVRDETPAA